MYVISFSKAYYIPQERRESKMTSTSDRNSLDCEISPTTKKKPTINSESNEPTTEFENNLYRERYKVCSLSKNSFETEEEFIDHSTNHSMKFSWNHTMSRDQGEDKNCTLHSEKMDTIIPNSTLVIRPFKCNLCGLVFDRISQFDNHSRSVHGQERSQVCQICGKGFFRPTDLKTHLNIHLGTNRCICEVCGRKFNHVSNLIRHSRTHSGVKPYPCTICGKRFTQINTLARHKAIHKRGDEIMDCCFCDKRYKSASGLKEHMRKLHGFTDIPISEENGRIIKRQHYCKICGESFQFVELLRAHDKTHQNVETLECKSCNQKFQKTDEINEHRCGRPKLVGANGTRNKRMSGVESLPVVHEDKNGLDSPGENESVLTQLGGVIEDSKERSSSNEVHTPAENLRIIGPKDYIQPDLDDRLCQDRNVNPNTLAGDTQTKKTIVYVTIEQLANMNTEQVVDAANHFLHQHLMELAAENSSQTDNIGPRDCDGETDVTEMINSCWKEIEMPDVNELELVEKRDSLISKNNTQSIIYIQALENDGPIFSNKNCKSTGSSIPEPPTEKCTDIKNDLVPSKNPSLHTEPQSVQTVKVCEEKFVEKHSSHVMHNEITTKKLSSNAVQHVNMTTNFRKGSETKYGNTNPIVKAIKEVKPERTTDYLRKENLTENNQLLVGTTNSPLTHNTFEELVKSNRDRVDNAVTDGLSENPEPTLRLVQTENGEEFYELLIANCSEKLENSSVLDGISAATVDENLRAPRFEPEAESLLKLVQLENGQRVLELATNTLSDEIERSEKAEDAERATTDSTFIGASALEKIERDENRTRNLPQNKCEKIFYLTHNNRDNLIDFFEIETLGTQEQSNFNLVSDEVMENVSQSSFDHLQTINDNKTLEDDESLIDNESCEELLGLIQSNVMKQNEKSKIDSKKTRKEEEGPMVRLVQNEDGAQFFELIRGDLEFDETQDFELVGTNESGQRPIAHPSNSGGSGMSLHVESCSTITETTKLQSDLARKRKQKNNPKKYNCDVCKKSFSKGYNYRQHIGTHFADQQKFKCKECGTFFAWKSTLNKHMATHRAGGQQKFVCEICPKVYTTFSQVNEHVKRDHLKERNHKCTHCAKTFFKKFDLKIHIRTHTKERPYECRICYKSFHHQSHIIRHERIHSGERPYACNICEKTFTQLGSLKNHRQRHQELKIDILDYQMDEDDPLPQTTL